MVEEKVRFYFELGLQHKAILQFCIHLHRVILSLRTLRRILNNINLFRRKNRSELLDVAMFLEEEIQKSGQMHGYKMMHLKSIQRGYVVNQDTDYCFTS